MAIDGILASAYGDRLTEGAAGQPVPEVARDGLAGALTVAAPLPDAARAALAATGTEAPVHGMDVTVTAGADLVAIGALLSWVLMPSRATMEADVGDPEIVEDDIPILAGR